MSTFLSILAATYLLGVVLVGCLCIWAVRNAGSVDQMTKYFNQYDADDLLPDISSTKMEWYMAGFIFLWPFVPLLFIGA